jgi:hypothetical protein
MPEAPKTWIVTGSPESFDATRDQGFGLIGMKQRRRIQALAMEPEGLLDESGWVAAEELEHVRKRPAEHCELAFQGQLRTVSDADAAVPLDRLHAAAGTPA